MVCFLGNNEWKLCSLQSQLKPRLLPAWDSIRYAAPLDQQACDLVQIALKSLGRRQSAFCTGILRHNGSLTRSGSLKKAFCLSSACQCTRGHQQSPLQRTQSLILIRLLHGGVYYTRGLPDGWRLCVCGSEKHVFPTIFCSQASRSRKE